MNHNLSLIIKFLFKPDRRTILLIITFICMIFIVARVSLNEIETQTKNNSQYALSTVLVTTQEALYMWLEQRQEAVKNIASSEKLIQLTELLLGSGAQAEKLIANSVSEKIREFFHPVLARFNAEGFFIISPDMVSMASMRDENVGTINIIYKLRKEYLVAAFNGETKFIATIPSDVPLYENSILKDSLPTQFIVSPIYSHKKKVIAVLAIRISPKKNFSRIIQLGRIGKSGETYAFDKNAVLISESRFDNELKLLGMIQPGDRGIARISITDPGGDLNKGYVTSVDNVDRPFTYMAEKAVAGKAGYNTDGYRDYRGVRVFGVWLWDEKLGFGLTTEIDEDEAMEPYYLSRFILISVLGLMLVLMYLLINVYRISEKEKQTVFSATVSMTQHILNNLLNQMQLFQLEAEKTKGFDSEVKVLIDDSIKEGEQLVKKLSSVKELNEDAIRGSVYSK